MPHAAIRRGSRLYTRSSRRPTPPQPLRIAAFRHRHHSRDRSEWREVRTPCTGKRRKPFTRVQVRRPHAKFTSPTSTSSHHPTPPPHTTTPNPAPPQTPSAIPHHTPQRQPLRTSDRPPTHPSARATHTQARSAPTHIAPIRPSRSRRLHASHRSARPARNPGRPYRSPAAAAQLRSLDPHHTRMPHAAIRRGSRLYTRSSRRPTPPQPLRIAAFRHQHHSREHSERREVRTPCASNRRKPFTRVQVRRPHVRFTSPASTSGHHRTPANHTNNPHPASQQMPSSIPHHTPLTTRCA